MGLNTRADDATLVQATRSGDHGAFEVLVQRWLPRAFDTAAFVLADASVAAEAAADGFEHVWRHRDELQPPSAFGAHLVRATRTAAALRAAAGAATADDEHRTTGLFTRDGVTAEERLVGKAKAADAMADPDITAVVRRAGVAVDPTDRSLLLAHLRDGVAVADLADDIGVEAEVMDQRLFRVRARYRAALEARVLWRSGHPLCGDLARIVGTGPSTRFDAETAATVIDHTEACTTCRTAKRLQATPAALLSLLPDQKPGDDTVEVVRGRLADAGFEVPEANTVSRWLLGGGADAGDDGPWHRRRRVLLAWGSAAAVVLAVVLLGLQPWSSGPKQAVGVLGGASDGTSAAGSIQANGSGTTTRTSHPGTTAKRHAPSPASSTTAPNNATSPTVSILPPVSLLPPATTTVNSPIVTAASATVIGRCGIADAGVLLRITWQTQNATSVTMVPRPLDQGPFPGTGDARVCVPSLPSTITLTATGPGGSASQDVMVAAPPDSTTTTSVAPAAAPPTSG